MHLEDIDRKPYSLKAGDKIYFRKSDSSLQFEGRTDQDRAIRLFCSKSHDDRLTVGNQLRPSDPFCIMNLIATLVGLEFEAIKETEDGVLYRLTAP